MRPRIAVISQQYGTLGGGEIFARQVTERIARRGRFEMHVFSRKWESDCPEVTVHRVPTWPVPRQLLPTAFAWMASRMARRGGFDLVHAQGRLVDADVFSVHHCPHLFWVRDILKRKPRWSDRLRMRLDEGMLRDATPRTFMTVSTLQRQVFEAEYGSLAGRWTTVHPGVDVDRFAESRLVALRDVTRRELRLPPDAVIALFVGMNFESKGLDVVVRAMAEARRLVPSRSPHVLVIGRGNESRYRQIAAHAGCLHAITFVGAQREGIERFFAAADLFMMPASFETFSMATLEAMAAGLPVIVSDRMGVRDLVRDGENGFVVSAEEIDKACASLLVRLLDDGVRKSMGEAARRTARAHAWDRVADAVEAVYHQHLAMRRDLAV